MRYRKVEEKSIFRKEKSERENEAERVNDKVIKRQNKEDGLFCNYLIKY